MFQDLFSDLQVDWKEIYLLAFKVSLEAKIREFQCQVLNDIVSKKMKNYLGLTWLNSHSVGFAKIKLNSSNKVHFLIVKQLNFFGRPSIIDSCYAK